MTTGLVSRPFFVKHLGVQSSLHSRGVRKDAEFIGSASMALITYAQAVAHLKQNGVLRRVPGRRLRKTPTCC